MAKSKDVKVCIDIPTLYAIWLNRSVATMDYTGVRYEYEMMDGQPLAHYSNH